MHGFQFPWEEWTAAAETGFDDRLVTLSSGMLTHFHYSTHHDYEGGEANDLVAVPTSRYTPTTFRPIAGSAWTIAAGCTAASTRRWPHPASPSSALPTTSAPLTAPMSRSPLAYIGNDSRTTAARR
jgi:hypothetical protein